jgi:hypothetical protein
MTLKIRSYFLVFFSESIMSGRNILRSVDPAILIGCSDGIQVEIIAYSVTICHLIFIPSSIAVDHVRM